MQLGGVQRAVDDVFGDAVQVHLKGGAHPAVVGSTHSGVVEAKLRANVLQDGGVGAAPVAKAKGVAALCGNRASQNMGNAPPRTGVGQGEVGDTAHQAAGQGSDKCLFQVGHHRGGGSGGLAGVNGDGRLGLAVAGPGGVVCPVERAGEVPDDKRTLDGGADT